MTVEWIVAIPFIAVIIYGIPAIVWGTKWQERPRRKAKPTTIPTTTATKPNSVASWTEYPVKTSHHVIARNVAHSPGRLETMEIRPAEPVVVEYEITMTKAELNAINRILEVFVPQHSGEIGWSHECQVAQEFMRANSFRDRI